MNLCIQKIIRHIDEKGRRVYNGGAVGNPAEKRKVEVMKMNPRMKKLLSMILTVVMVISCMAMPISAAGSGSAKAIINAVQSVYDANAAKTFVKPAESELGEPVTIMVKLEGETKYIQTSDLAVAAANADKQLSNMAKAERRIEKVLNENIQVENKFTLLFNGFSFTGYEWMVDAINSLDGVTAFVAPVFELVEPETESEATPSMYQSTGLTGADYAWDLGYTGEGMVVAIIDTGIRSTHEAFSVQPENGRIDKEYLEQVVAQYGDLMHAGTDVNGLYYDAKMPFNYDYFDFDYEPNHTKSDHGTHVAGIAAGNNGADFKGVAPDAQIVTMQVFTDQGGASFATLMMALEDAVYLGVDAVNMSLGVAAYFSSYDSISSDMEIIYDALENAGVAVCAAAGNDGHTNVWNNLGDYFYSQYRWKSINMDIGTIGAPATFPGSLAVASVVNTGKEGGGYLNADGINYYPTAIADNPTLGELTSGEYEIVFVGLASPEEIEAAGGVEGKIALTQRGTLTFTAKAENCAAAGAVACLIFNNTSGAFNPSITSPIPFGAMTLEDGLDLKSSLADGVHGTVNLIAAFAYGTVGMASSSSWGTTADLLIKPEIAAPGDGITSAIGFGDDASYESWNGTSMATPHIAGGMLLVKQRLNEMYPDATKAEINNMAHAILMSTAHQVNGFVRQQGAGLMDLDGALTTDAYLTVDGGRPKLELDDSADGSFTFHFEITNMGSSEKTYGISASIMTEVINDFDYDGSVMGDREYNEETGYLVANPTTETLKVSSGVIKNVTKMCIIDAPESVSVPAGETVTVEMTITCNDDLMAYFAENCEAGMYLEGFINLTDYEKGGAELSIPFLGFVGDWDYAPMFDEGFWWNLPYGENNMSQYPIAKGTYIGYGVWNQGLGLNPYADSVDADYNEARNIISPNGDDLLDTVNYAEFSMMRNPKTMKAYVTDAEGNILSILHDSTYNYRKEYYTGSMNGGITYSSMALNFDPSILSENETAYLVIEAWLDHAEYDPADNMNGRMVFPFTVDTIAPAVNAVEGGVEIVDTNFVAYYAVYADAALTELLFETGIWADENGQAEIYETDLDTYYVAVADYGRNEAVYAVSGDSVTLIANTIEPDTGKVVIGRQYIDYAEGYYKYGWVGFDNETAVAVENLSEMTYEMSDYAASGYGFDFLSGTVGMDGNLYVNTISDLHILDTETYETTLVTKFWTADGKTPYVKNIFTNPETHEIYGYGSIAGVGTGILKVNELTGEVNFLWEITDIDGANQLSSCDWAATMIDGSTVALWGHYGDIGFYDLETGIGFDYIDLNFNNPQYGLNQMGINGVCGSMLYDDETNTFYLYSNWMWLGENRYDVQGHIQVDMNTGITTLHTLRLNDLAIHGIAFAEDIKPAPCYVEKLIASIGEVTLDDADAIKAARAAYDALSAEEKAEIANYNDLLMAEHQYAILLAENASYTAALVYAKMMLKDLADTDLTGLSAAEQAAFAELLAQFEEDLANATSGRQIADLMEQLVADIDDLLNGCAAKNFTDVSVDAWYHDPIDFVVGEGLMVGISDTAFNPSGKMNRAQMVTVLYRMAGEPEVKANTTFTDVPADSFYADAVAWAVETGITNGVSATAFGPFGQVTREQMVTFIYRFAEYSGMDTLTDADLSAYTDAASVSSWAVSAFAWATENGLVQGMTETTLVPGAVTNRAQVATVIMRFCNN